MGRPEPPPPQYASSASAPGGPRLLHVYHAGLIHRETQIFDTDKRNPLYTIKINRGSVFSSKPHMTVCNAATGSVIGAVTFRNWSGTIDLNIHGRSLSFEKTGMLTTAHQFKSLAVGHTFKWKRDGVFSGGDMICEDERGQLVARFESSLWAVNKDGKFEVGPTVQGPFMDEIVISGLAMVEDGKRRARRGAAGGAGGGGGGG